VYHILFRYSFIAYGIFAVSLRVISNLNHENTKGFISTLVYPSIVFILSIFAIVYWLLIPILESIVKCYEIKKRSFIASKNIKAIK